MRSSMKTVCAAALGVLMLAGLGDRMAAQASLIFQDAWDRAGGTGCDFAKITDSSAWDDYGPSATCSGTPHVADLVTDERVDGTSSLRINFEPDGSGNGPDFRIVKSFGSNRNEIYARWYTKWSNNWVFAGGDHKVAIFGAGSQVTQDVYYNIRGNGGGGPSGRVTIHVIPSDTAFSDPTFNVTPGVWHLCEIHIVSGSNGRVEAKMDGRLLNLAHEAGTSQSANNLNTGAGVGYIKLDTTYNIYSYPSSLGLHMNMWYDAVAVGTSAWIGGLGGTPPPPAPASPTNVRVIR
jgi:hypothetical protein